MAKRSAARRAEEDTGRDDPSRPDNIPSQPDDQESLESIHAEDAVVDVNAPIRDDDARSDEEKAEAARQVDDAEAIRQRANEDQSADRVTDDDDSQAARRRRRRNRERDVERDSDERVTNLTAENRKLTDRLLKLERGGNQQQIEGNLSALKSQLESTKQLLSAAIEGGKTAEQLELTIKLGEIQSKIALSERDLEVAKRQPEPAADASTADVQEKKRPKLVDDWMRANRGWFNRPENASLQRHARLIDEQILADIDDGTLDYDKYSEDHIDEMTKRLAAKAEELGIDVEIKDFNGEVFELDEEEEQTAANGRDKGKDVKTTGKRPAAGGMGGRAGVRKAPTDLELARQGKARLLPADFAQMRTFKLDPNDPAARKAFAKERVRTLLTEANKAGGRR